MNSDKQTDKTAARLAALLVGTAFLALAALAVVGFLTVIGVM